MSVLKKLNEFQKCLEERHSGMDELTLALSELIGQLALVQVDPQSLRIGDARLRWLMSPVIHRLAEFDNDKITQKDRIGLITQWLKVSHDIDQRNAAQQTALHVMAMQGNLPICKALVGLGADIHLSDHLSMSMLHRAVLSDNSDLVQYFCEQGVSTSLLNSQSETALMLAIAKRNEVAIDCLLAQKDCPIEAADRYGDTALHMAVQGVDLPLIKKLIEAGFNSEISNHLGYTAEMLASQFTGNHHVHQYLKEINHVQREKEVLEQEMEKMDLQSVSKGYHGGGGQNEPRRPESSLNQVGGSSISTNEMDSKGRKPEKSRIRSL